MLTRSQIALGMQEFMNIQSKVAPDQCELPRLSGQAAAAQRAGDLGKRQELIKRLQSNQPRIQELAKYVQAPSPDYQVLMQQNIDLRAK